eukprot:8324127-Alexandrium_andersonii.AAC.1
MAPVAAPMEGGRGKVVGRERQPAPVSLFGPPRGGGRLAASSFASTAGTAGGPEEAQALARPLRQAARAQHG